MKIVSEINIDLECVDVFVWEWLCKKQKEIIMKDATLVLLVHIFFKSKGWRKKVSAWGNNEMNLVKKIYKHFYIFIE